MHANDKHKFQDKKMPQEKHRLAEEGTGALNT